MLVSLHSLQTRTPHFIDTARGGGSGLVASENLENDYIHATVTSDLGIEAGARIYTVILIIYLAYSYADIDVFITVEYVYGLSLHSTSTLRNWKVKKMTARGVSQLPPPPPPRLSLG